MNGVSRFLSRRDKKHDKEKHRHRRTKEVSNDLYKIWSSDEDKKADKEEEKKVKGLLQELASLGITQIKEPQVEYVLRTHTNGDTEKALDLLVLFQDSLEGIIKEYDPDVKLLGAINRENVTCYLDALLFAMFARIDSFEGMLYNSFEDHQRKELGAKLRLWVNLLRTGRLIHTDLTKMIQESLAACGWEEAAEVCQQDSSEAFTFITGKLELPLLTLKMDIFHYGKEDAADDHKLVNERLLEVAIPEKTEDGAGEITLEECLEQYFNNRIEVKRHLQRRNTLQSVKVAALDTDKNETMHIETLEVVSPSTPTTPGLSSPTYTESSQVVSSPLSPIRPGTGRSRADSIFSERYVSKGEPSEKQVLDDLALPRSRPRGLSVRKEVMMPAWQFYSLIPWYTSNTPTNDTQVAAHFAAKRPMLGICLKRYVFEANGAAKKLETYIDIPLDIRLPHFISDDAEEGRTFGNFRLSLQSVVCHRGVNTHSGHYIALVRGEASNATPEHSGAATGPDRWMRFDDLATERVSYVDITKALKEESPYLLFYRVEPIDDQATGDLPTYEEANAGSVGTGSVIGSRNPSVEGLSDTMSDAAEQLPSVNPSYESIIISTDPSTSDTILVEPATKVPPHHHSRSLPLPTVPPTTSARNSLDVPRPPRLTHQMSTSPDRSLSTVTTQSALSGTTDAYDFGPATSSNSNSDRPKSLDLSSIPSASPDPRGRSSFQSDYRRPSLAFASEDGRSLKLPGTAPATPGDETKTGFISTMTRKASKRRPKENKADRSRPTSAAGESRLSLTMTRLKGAVSKDRLNDATDGGATIAEAEVLPENAPTKPLPSPAVSTAGAGAGTGTGGTLGRGKSVKHKSKDKKKARETSKQRGSKADVPDRECIVM